MTTPRRMIVVDDDPKVRLLLERAFRTPEFETHSFPTGKAALARVSEIKPDCVVSDILMPDMDGESLLRALRAVPGLEAVPFIALSAVRSEARIRAVIGAGADAFLLKPFPLRELTEKVRSLVERPQAARQSRGPLGEDMQPTRPVQRAPHTMSTTSLRKRQPQTEPPLAGEPAPGPVVEGAFEPSGPRIIEPSAVRLESSDPYPTPVPALPPPPASLAPLPPPAAETVPEPAPEATPVQSTPEAAPTPQPETAPVVRMAGPVRVLTSGTPSRAASDTAPSTRPLAPVRLAAPPPFATEGAARRIELGPKEPGLGFGRFTRVEMRGRSFVVLTEAVAKPTFTLTTVITEKGVPLRKVESALPHPLAREEDAETVRRQLDLQHDEVLRRLDDLVLDGARRRVLWSDQSRSVDGGLLAWALSAVAQLAEAEIGTEETSRQLHLTRERALVTEDVLRAFQITPAARVVLDASRGRELPRRAVRAAGAWCHDFATSALLLDDNQVAEPVRQATRRHGDDLARMGFYDRLKRRSKT
jgi:CheY-like chemotaxis protein